MDRWRAVRLSVRSESPTNSHSHGPASPGLRSSGLKSGARRAQQAALQAILCSKQRRLQERAWAPATLQAGSEEACSLVSEKGRKRPAASAHVSHDQHERRQRTALPSSPVSNQPGTPLCAKAWPGQLAWCCVAAPAGAHNTGLTAQGFPTHQQQPQPPSQPQSQSFPVYQGNGPSQPSASSPSAGGAFPLLRVHIAEPFRTQPPVKPCCLAVSRRAVCLALRSCMPAATC